MQALRHMPSDVSEEEKKELLDLLRISDELEKEFEKVKRKNHERQI